MLEGRHCAVPVGAVVGADAHRVQVLLGLEHGHVVFVAARAAEHELLLEGLRPAGYDVRQGDDFHVLLPLVGEGVGARDVAGADDADFELFLG